MTDIPENALRARDRYAAGTPTRDIKRETGFSTGGLYYWLAGGPKKNGLPVLPPIEKRNSVVRRSRPNRTQLVERMMRAAEQQIRAVEERLAGTQQEPGAAERDARTLAVLARTLQSLTALDAAHEPKAGRPNKKLIADDDDDEDAIPASIDALRRELSKRLEGMAAGPPGRIPGEADD